MEIHRTLEVLHPEPNGVVGAAAFQPAPLATVELLKYWRVVKPHAKLIGMVAFVAMLAVVLFDKFVATTYYQAKVVITPEPPGSEMTGGAAGGLASGLLNSVSGGLAGMAMPLLDKGDNELESQQDISILSSYDFTTNLVKRFQLKKKILARDGKDPSRMTPWKIYESINRNFGTDYDYKNGGLTLYYVDRDPAIAKQVLGYYIQALQDKLRNQEVTAASTAVKALEEEVSHTPDPMLQSQLYTLMAYQIQRQKTAQIEADFAFKVVEPPMVPGVKYSPVIRQQAALAGFLAVFLLSAYFLGREWLSHAHAYLNALDIGPSKLNGPAHENEKRNPELFPEVKELLLR